MNTLSIDSNGLTPEDIYDVAQKKNIQITLSEDVKNKVLRSRAFIDRCIQEKRIIYGVTTGFGQFKNKMIDVSQIQQLQKNLIESHAIGTGGPLPEYIVRAMILIRANSLAQGYSGVRLNVITKLLEILHHNIYPYVPAQGSVGASGDLAPLSHLALVLLGEGEVLVEGKRMPAASILQKVGIKPLVLEAKEGLALNNGTAMMTAFAVINLIEAERLLTLADIAAAMSLEVMMGSVAAYDERIQKIRKHIGQEECAGNIRKLCEGSEIILSHKDCDRVQDSYSLRCVPQVHGAIRDAMRHIRQVVTKEVNAVTDNPLIFAEEEKVISGGNFHGAPIALVMDFMAIALTDLASISERRTFKLLDANLSEGLPAFLIEPAKAGLNSGYMIAQYTSAALVAENKVLAHPVSVDSIPTSANQEDHVSFGSIAARKAYEVIKNTRKVLAIELMCAAQGVDFRRPLRAGRGTEVVYELIRKRIPPLDHDRILSVDLEHMVSLVSSEDFFGKICDIFGELH